MAKGTCEHCKQKDQTLFECVFCGATVCPQCTSELHESICLECEYESEVAI